MIQVRCHMAHLFTCWQDGISNHEGLLITHTTVSVNNRVFMETSAHTGPRGSTVLYVCPLSVISMLSDMMHDNSAFVCI